MNIDEARDLLIDLVYGELDEPRRSELLRLVDANPQLAEELASLRAARSALAFSRADEPVSRSTGILPVSTAGILPAAASASSAVSSSRSSPVVSSSRKPRRTLRLIGWLSPLAAAAAIVIAVMVLFPPNPKPPVALAQAPVEITKTEISLTILSEPEEQSPQPRYPSIAQAAMPYANGPGSGVQTVAPWTVNREPYGWQGLAVVRDQRLIRNLPKGDTEVRFTDVPAGIIAESVRLRSLDNPADLKILEQNYEYDLAGEEAILRHYVDKPITLVPPEGKDISGTLLGFSPEDFIIRPQGEGPRNVSREKLRAVRLAELPKGLLTRPTLVWKVDNQAPINQQMEVSYMTHGLSWRADYVLRLSPGMRVGGGAEAQRDSGNVKEDAKPQAGSQTQAVPANRHPLASSQTLASSQESGTTTPQSGSENANPKIFDTAELVGYATVTNDSGVAYENAQLKLLAGDVHLVQEEFLGDDKMAFGNRKDGVEEQLKREEPAFQEKSFFEYHLYTLGRPTSLANAETKQIELVAANGINLSRGYVYDQNVNPTAARVVSEFKNSKENGHGLGRPLPKGVIRLYAPDPTGEETYVAQTSIDHTPKDEKVRLPWGFAFDIVCSARQTDNHIARTYTGGQTAGSRKWQYVIRNHKDYDVTVTVMVHVPASTTDAQCNLAGGKFPWHVREVGLVEIYVPVKAGGSATVDFSFNYDDQKGGGLQE